MADRLAVVVAGDDDALHLTTEVPGSQSWSAWEALGGPPGERPVMPTLVSTHDGCLVVFAFSTTHLGMWHRRQLVPNGDWDDWVRDPDPPAVTWDEGDVAVKEGHEGRLHMFCVNASDRRPPLAQPRNKVWHRQQAPVGDGWSPWRQQGQPPDAEEILLAMERNLDGRLELIAGVHTPRAGERFETWRLREESPGGQWSRWELATPTAGPGHGYLPRGVVRGPDGRLVAFGGEFGSGQVGVSEQVVPGGDWQAWVSLGKPDGGSVLPVAAVVGADGLLDVFAVEETLGEGPNGIWTVTRGSSGTWGGWSSLDAPPPAIGSSGVEVAVALSPGGRLHVLATAADGALWCRSRAAGGGAWSTWASTGGPTTTTSIWMPSVHPV